MYIGKRIRELRKAQRVTLIELSKTSGVQIATLSRIENEKMVGTLDSHMQIAKALGLDVTQLYAGIVPDKSKIDYKPARSNTDVFVHSSKSAYEILTPNVLSKKMMPILLKIEPGGKTNKEQNQTGTEKFIYVLDGRIEAHINKEVYRLTRHNSLYFVASLPHYIINIGTKLARVISICTPVAL